MPKNFKCETCGKAFESTRDLSRHKSRKNPCVAFIEKQNLPEEKRSYTNLCKFCGRAFSCPASVTRHLKNNCKIVPRNGDMSGMDKLFEHVLQRDRERDKEVREQGKLIRVLLDEMKIIKGGEELKIVTEIPSASGPLASLSGSGNKNALVNINKGIIDQSIKNTVNNVLINVFGDENTSHITHADILAILQGAGPLGENLRPAAEKVMLQTAMLIHSDEKHPENITCYMPNKKSKQMIVHGANGWEMVSSGLGLSPMACSALDVLFAKQPYPGENGAPSNLDDITRLMGYLKTNEGSLVGDAAKPGSEYLTIPIRNKDILARTLKKLPVAGDA